MIDELESGITTDPNIVKDIRQHYEYLKEEKTKSHNPLDQIEIEAKCKVLNIYINCIHTIEKAMSLSKWYTLDLQVVSIDSEMVKDAASTATIVDGTISVERGYGLPTDNLVSWSLFFFLFNSSVSVTYHLQDSHSFYLSLLLTRETSHRVNILHTSLTASDQKSQLSKRTLILA